MVILDKQCPNPRALIHGHIWALVLNSRVNWSPRSLIPRKDDCGIGLPRGKAPRKLAIMVIIPVGFPSSFGNALLSHSVYDGHGGKKAALFAAARLHNAVRQQLLENRCEVCC